MTRVVLYYRVSSDEQTVEHQKHAVRAFCDARGWRYSPEHEIHDVMSGAQSRAGWTRVLEIARSGKVQHVVTWSLDRVGRTLWAISDAVRALDAAGAPIVTLQEPWLESADELTRGLLVAVFSYVAAFERKRLIARTLEGHATARRLGKRMGRPRRLMGAAMDAAIDARRAGQTWGQIRTMVRTKFGKDLPKSTIAQAVTRMEHVLINEYPRDDDEGPKELEG